MSLSDSPSARLPNTNAVVTIDISSQYSCGDPRVGAFLFCAIVQGSRREILYVLQS